MKSQAVLKFRKLLPIELYLMNLATEKSFAQDKWVPKQLTDNFIKNSLRLDICRELLRSKSSRRVHGHTANAGGDFLGYDVTFLDSIVTGDETWLHHCTPETKQDSMTWKHPSSPVAKKFKVMRSAKKIMGTVFWDSRGFLKARFDHVRNLHLEKI